MKLTMDQLFERFQLGALALPNRIVMAPMTRGRATADRVPTPIMADYYRQRAGAGLIVTEATAISPQGYGWVQAPAVYSQAQVAGWKAVTDAVHQAGGRISLQLWHMGRASHPDFLGGDLPVAPSAIRAEGTTFTPSGKKSYVTPRALDAAELPGIVGDYVQAARNAMAAGFDMVEIHSANGYLLDQFLRDGSNHRTDLYGGSIANRLRFPREVMEAVAAAVGAERTGIRFSPRSQYNDMSDSSPFETFRAAIEAAKESKLAYVHVVDPVNEGEQIHPRLRPFYDGVLIVNGGYTGETARKTIQDGTADLIAFGVPFLANPDLPERLRDRQPLAQPNFDKLYGGGAEGYSDYPALTPA